MEGMDLLFGTPKPLCFLRKKFDFTLNPAHFIKWLKAEGEEVTGNYAIDSTSMCEYACLYAGMMLYGKKLKGELLIYYGKFGFWEHYWLGYRVDGEEYYIDLTLKQFVQNAPKLAITKAQNERVAGAYSYLSEGEPLKAYVKSHKAFRFYTNPHTMAKPKDSIHDFAEDMSEHINLLTSTLKDLVI